MNVTFYQCTCDNRYVDKSNFLTAYSGVSSVVLYEGCSIVSPVIRVTWAGGAPAVNYCYIPTFGRYYYVTNVEALEGNSVKYYLRCDVLMTYGGSIKTSSQTVIRSESIGHPTMIPDEHYTLEPRKQMKVIKFDGGFFDLANAGMNTYNFILNVSGGGSSTPPSNSVDRIERSNDGT